jgi:hypothetical protein
MKRARNENGAVARAVLVLHGTGAIYRARSKPLPAEDSPMLQRAPGEHEPRSPIAMRPLAPLPFAAFPRRTMVSPGVIALTS